MAFDKTNSFVDFNTDFENGNGIVLKYISGKGYPDKGYFAVTKLGTLYNLYDLDYNTFVENKFTDKETLQKDLTQYGVYKVTTNVDYTVSNNGEEDSARSGKTPFSSADKTTSTTSTTTPDKPKATTTTTTSESTQQPNSEQPEHTESPKSSPEEDK